MSLLSTAEDLPTDGEPLCLDGRFECEWPLGRGAAGVVWAARDVTSGSAVAVKLFHAEASRDPLAARRFQREVSLAARLDHPHIVRLLHHGLAPDGRLFLVMERVTGGSLAQLLASRGGHLPLVQVFRVAQQILSGLELAHAAGIVHRDLKPANVLLEPSGAGEPTVKLCDFGLAKSFGPEADRSTMLELSSNVHGELCGTPEYMSPEQVRNEPVDGRADLYALGIILYQCLVGEVPFRARSAMAVASRQLTEPPRRPSELRPGLALPRALEQLVLRALAKDRAERPSSAAVFRAELAQIEHDWASRPASDAARPDGLGPDQPTLVPTAAGPPSARGLAAGILAAAVGLTVLAVWPWAREQQQGAPRAGQQPPAPIAVPAAPPPPPEVSPTAPPTQLRPLPAPRTSDPPRPGRTARPRAQPLPAILQESARLQAEGQVERACAVLDRALRAHGGAAELHRALGRCYMRLGDTTRARSHYQRYLQLAPQAPDVTFVRAMLHNQP